MIFIYLIGSALMAAIATSLRFDTGYRQGKAYKVILLGIGDDLYLEYRSAIAFHQMRALAKQHGIELRANGPRSAFRTPAMQRELIGARPQYAASEGWSPHQRGVAIDLDVTKPETLQWLRDNAKQFGFYETNPPTHRTPEPWHWQYLL